MHFPKVCYICSEEPFLIKQKFLEYKKEFLKLYNEINYSEIKVGNSNRALSESLETMPFMAEKRMIVLNGTITEDVAELLYKVPDYCSVFIIEPLDKRTKLYKNIKKVGEIVELERFNEKKITEWVINTGKDMGLDISSKVASKVIQLTNLDNMSQIYTELVKLSSMGVKSISEEIVERVVTQSPDYNSFAIVNAISKRNKVEAYKLIQIMSEKNEYLPLVLSNINRNFAIIRMMKAMLDGKIKEETGVHPYTLKLLRSDANNFSKEQLDKLMELCQKIDYDMKNGMDHRIALEELVGVI